MLSIFGDPPRSERGRMERRKERFSEGRWDPQKKKKRRVFPRGWNCRSFFSVVFLLSSTANQRRYPLRKA